MTDRSRGPLTDMRDEDANDDMIARYLLGELSVQERAAFRDRLAVDSALQRAVEESERALAVAGLGLRDESWDVDAGFASLTRKLPNTNQTSARKSAQVSRLWLDTGLLMKAAGLGVVLLASGLVLKRIIPSAPESTLTVSRQAPDSLGAGVVYTTGVGERRTVSLSDGSTVELGVASSLEVAPGYGRGARQVTLQGEALFTVTHDSANPFRVLARDLVVQDLGTEFAVRAYPAAPIRVSVASGVVEVRPPLTRDSANILNALDVATVPDTGRTDVRRGVDVTSHLAFARGRLVFRDTPFDEVMAELERWFDIEFRIPAGVLSARRYTSEFEQMTVDQVLAVIGPALQVRFVRQGRVVELAPMARAESAPAAPTQVGRGA